MPAPPHPIRSLRTERSAVQRLALTEPALAADWHMVCERCAGGRRTATVQRNGGRRCLVLVICGGRGPSRRGLGSLPARPCSSRRRRGRDDATDARFHNGGGSHARGRHLRRPEPHTGQALTPPRRPPHPPPFPPPT